MRERPILFSGPMVRAILDGSKTQTRRVVKEGKKPREANIVEPVQDFWRFTVDGGGAYQSTDIDCPYGNLGDRLWVRETFRVVDDPAAYHVDDGRCEPFLYEGVKYKCKDAVRRGDNGERFVVDYRADNPSRIMDKIGKPKWKPSIYMPRWASRITLEVTGVRVERLNEISKDDAIAEGVDWVSPEFYGAEPPEPDSDGVAVGDRHGPNFARDNFRRLWESINGKGSWATNPWVWVVEFKRLEQEESRTSGLECNPGGNEAEERTEAARTGDGMVVAKEGVS